MYITFDGVELSASADTSKVSPIYGFLDQDGFARVCALYTFRLYIDGHDITPRAPMNPVVPLSQSGFYSENLDDRNISRYFYVGFGGDMNPVGVGEWHTYNFTVVPTGKTP